MCSYKNKYHAILIIVILFLLLNRINAQNQLTFIITSVPDYTPKTDSIFLVTSFDHWINNPQKKFKYYPNGHYRLTVDIGNIKNFEYKINRGNWNKAEGNSKGEYRENRHFMYNDSITEVKLVIESWQDLHALAYPSIRVLVLSIPQNTPHDASIFIAGNFNNWTVDDHRTKLIETAPGKYEGAIPAGSKDLSFKFTRGTWQSAECRWDGGMRSNRSFNADKAIDKQIVADIAAWDDLSKGIIWIKLIFLILFLQSILLTLLLVYYSSPKILILIAAFLTIAFLAKFLYADHSLFHTIPFVYFLPVILYSFFGPLLYLWLASAITAKAIKVSYIHFIPLIPLIWFLQYLGLPGNEFYLKVVNNDLNIFVFGSYAYALVINLYLNSRLKIIIARNIAAIPDLTYSLYRALLTYYLISIFILLIGGICIWQKVDPKFVIDWLDNLLWFGAGIVLIYYEFFFFTSIYSRYSSRFGNTKDVILSKDTWITLKVKLTELMETKAVYSNPNLSLSDLAGNIGTNKHYVSKLINDGFKKKFKDYINEYRIKAFIHAVENDKNSRTFLFHAFEVGFNSKSSFNRAFKKVTSKTPSEYFINIK